jgi:hypothetical protein
VEDIERNGSVMFGDAKETAGSKTVVICIVFQVTLSEGVSSFF